MFAFINVRFYQCLFLSMFAFVNVFQPNITFIHSQNKTVQFLRKINVVSVTLILHLYRLDQCFPNWGLHPKDGVI